MTLSVTSEQVMGFRLRAQQLDRESGGLDDTAVLDLGVQDTGADGASWALALRGVDVSTVTETDLVTVWTIRGAPHVYRRKDLPAVAAAVAPFSEADAGKRIYDAAKPLREAGISSLTALDAVAAAMRSVVTAPMVKGEVSRRVTQVMPAPYLRECRPCNATHLYEMPFRLAALRAGLELQPGTSPPVLRRIPGFPGIAEPPARFDVVRGYLRLLGPATPAHVAGYLDAPVREVKARWPPDALQVSVDGEARWVLADSPAELAPAPPAVTRLLAPFDLFLQARDRPLLVPERHRASALWPVLGRPGAVLAGGALVGTWRPRMSRGTLAVRVEGWTPISTATRRAISAEAERLAAHRQARLSSVDIEA